MKYKVLRELGWTVFVIALASLVGIWSMNIQKSMHKGEAEKKLASNGVNSTNNSIEKSQDGEAGEQSENDQMVDSKNGNVDEDTHVNTKGADAYEEEDLLAQATEDALDSFKKEHATKKKEAHKELNHTAEPGKESSFLDNALNLYEKLSGLN